jgi:hypothetical protein
MRRNVQKAKKIDAQQECASLSVDWTREFISGQRFTLSVNVFFTSICLSDTFRRTSFFPGTLSCNTGTTFHASRLPPANPRRASDNPGTKFYILRKKFFFPGKTFHMIGTTSNSRRALSNDCGTTFNRRRTSPNNCRMLADSFCAASNAAGNPDNNF